MMQLRKNLKQTTNAIIPKYATKLEDEFNKNEKYIKDKKKKISIDIYNESDIVKNKAKKLKLKNKHK